MSGTQTTDEVGAVISAVFTSWLMAGYAAGATPAEITLAANQASTSAQGEIIDLLLSGAAPAEASAQVIAKWQRRAAEKKDNGEKKMWTI